MVVEVVASVGKDAAEGGTVFVDGSFREEKDVGAVGGDEGDDVGVLWAVSTCFFGVLCDDSEVLLYACYLFFVLRYVLLCVGLGVGSWICTVYWRSGEGMAFVCGRLVLGERRFCCL